MQSNRSRETSNWQPGCRVRAVRVRKLLVWALIGMGLLAWHRPSEGRPSEGQASRQQEVQLVQGQMLNQPPDGQVLARPVQPGQVTVDGGMLSVSLSEARLREVMEAIASQAGMKVSFFGAVGQATLTASFVGLSLEDGLRRLLQGMNYAFAYTGRGATRRVGHVFVMSGAADQPQAVAVETADESGAALVAALQKAMDTQRFAETVKAAITAEGGTTQENETAQEEVVPGLSAAFQRVLSGQDEPEQLRNQFRQVSDRLQQLLEQSGQ